MSQQTIDWTVLNELLPTEKSSGGSSDHTNDDDNAAQQQQQQQELRRRIFTQYFDSNNNGICSLAECDKGIQELLPTFYHSHVLTRPVILRAFTAAKGIGQEEGSSNNSGSGDKDYIEWAEFRMFLLYLKQYAALWELFEHVDSSSSSSTDQVDRRISLEEFTATVPQLMMDRFGIVIEDATATFQQIDTNQGGHILFVEFADWAIREKLIPLHE
jgi:hypothetical protein